VFREIWNWGWTMAAHVLQRVNAIAMLSTRGFVSVW
jgi:hypothetical protein